MSHSGAHHERWRYIAVTVGQGGSGDDPRLETQRSVISFLYRMRRPLVVAIHVVLVAFSSYAAIWLRFDGTIPNQNWTPWISTLPWLLLIRGVTFAPFRLYEGLWRYTSLWDLRNIILAVVVSTTLFYLFVHLVLGLTGYPRSVFIVDSIVLIGFLSGIRLGRRVWREFGWMKGDTPVLIYGAGDAGEMLVREMRKDKNCGRQPIGFVDDDPGKKGQQIHGVPVLGTREALSTIIERQAPKEVLIAVSQENPAIVRAILGALEPFKVPITTMPDFRELLENGTEALRRIRNLSVEDLLPRAPVDMDPAPVGNLLKGKRVLVTGAGGSIGTELCRQICDFEPASLALYERYESGLYAIAHELEERGYAHQVTPIVGDVTDMTRLEDALRRETPQIIFHAAAHKHVPMMELNPGEAVKNNISGTWMTAQAADKFGAERFILISSDKAVNPTSVMGATKRISELIIQGLAARSATTFTAVRFGNVLGSSGSVVPMFLEQIKSGGPVTVTHPDVRRYFMLTSEAVQLVLQAAAIGDSGVMFVLDMGDQIKVVDMARNLIRLSGFIPDRDVEISYIGLRRGEKLCEELVGSDEVAVPSGVANIVRVQSATPVAISELFTQIVKLERDAASSEPVAVIRTLREVVPAYRPYVAGAAESAEDLPVP